jgi:hypothetical protein
VFFDELPYLPAKIHNDRKFCSLRPRKSSLGACWQATLYKAKLLLQVI